jgi:hypothetical protein
LSWDVRRQLLKSERMLARVLQCLSRGLR